jgi:hypothetical protein
MGTLSPETRAQRAIESFKLGHLSSLKAGALALNAPVSTVYHRAAERLSNAHKSKSQRALDMKKEKVLIKWIFQLYHLGVRARLTVEMGFSHGKLVWDSLPIKSEPIFRCSWEWEFSFLCQDREGIYLGN